LAILWNNVLSNFEISLSIFIPLCFSIHINSNNLKNICYYLDMMENTFGHSAKFIISVLLVNRYSIMSSSFCRICLFPSPNSIKNSISGKSTTLSISPDKYFCVILSEWRCRWADFILEYLVQIISHDILYFLNLLPFGFCFSLTNRSQILWSNSFLRR